MNVFDKQPSEIETISVDFVDVLDTGETIASMTAVATDSTGTVVTSTIINGSNIVSSKCLVNVKAGTSGNTYKVTIKATTNLSNVYEEDVFLRVREI